MLCAKSPALDRSMVIKMENYIDIHSHILPGVDDGAGSMEMSLEMLRMADGDGIVGIILTPHSKPWHRRRNCVEIAAEAERLRDKLREEGLLIKLYTGNELYYRSGLTRELEDGLAGTLAGSRYALVEFAPSADFDFIRKGVYELLTGGYRPVLAHAERYKNLCADKKGVAELTAMGCFMQVNAGSVMGRYGFGVMGLTRKMLKQGMVHFIATDAHDRKRRRPCLSECAKYVEKKFGADSSRRLFFDNPLCVLKDEDITMTT